MPRRVRELFSRKTASRAEVREQLTTPKSPSSKRILGGIVALTTVIVSTSLVLGQGGGGGGGGTANIWADANGGTCADDPSLVAYVDEAACSLDAANDTCEAGDTIRIQSLSGDQSLSGSNARGSNCLVKPAVDGTPFSWSGKLTLQSTTTWLSFTDIQQTIDTDDYSNLLQIDGDNLTFTRPKATRFEFSGTASNNLIDNGDFGPCIASYGTGGAGSNSNNQGVCNNRFTGTATNNTVQDSDIHGNLQVWNGVAGPNGEPPHSECIAIFGSIGTKIWRNRLWDCGDSANTLIQADGTGQKATDLSIVGNWFNVAWNDVDGDDPPNQEKCTGVDLRVADLSGSFEFSFNALNRCTSSGGLEIPWVSTNSGDGARYGASLTSVRFVGNIGTTVAGGGGGGCPTNSGNNLIDYNVQQRWQDGNTTYLTCGANATLISGANSFWVNTTKHGAFDFHVTGSTQSWENTILTSVAGGCPTDIDGTSRPIGSNCDPGPDER